ncbi:hypothetical protein [Tenacibaculum ovolyticum]|uniref:hypothetical protein n=1 Tax=Tenacibaculum ovolyticum TaxID=104270 RepID=UPI001F18D556|nr:hypothetical protein [Tenacibaculum ovolyticum]
MKKLMSILVLLLFTGCCHPSYKLVDNYRGYIYDSKNEPLENVRIHEMDYKLVKYTYTDKKGYFFLKKESSNFVSNLLLEKEGYVTDTVFSFSESRFGNKTRFLMEWSDTVYMEKNRST